MIPLEQTRIGEDGNCFAACLASILETGIPEFGTGAGYWRRVARFLARRGLRYERAPVKGSPAPLGYSTLEGVSPRGGLHAVVAYDGRFVHDPHPVADDPRRGLKKVIWYGLLLPLETAGRDAAKQPSGGKPPAVGAPIKLPNGKRSTVAKVTHAKNLFDEPEWHVLTTTGEVLTVPIAEGK